MVLFGVRGPKELLASAIAAALDKYFEVDRESGIESKLLRDARIVLRNVRLRPRRNVVECGGKVATVAAVTTGVVREVVFTWSWSLGRSTGEDDTSWVKDATLTVQGLDFQTQLSYEESSIDVDDDGRYEVMGSEETNMVGASSELETIRREGKLHAYIRNQVEQIIDALTLRVMDFEYALELPLLRTEGQGAEKRQIRSGISVGGKLLELRSLGRQRRHAAGEGTATSSTNQEQYLELVQQLSVGSFYINTFSFKEENARAEAGTLPLLSPLSYEATATRSSGKRFGGLGTGVQFVGRPLPPSSSTTTDAAADSETDANEGSAIVFHAGNEQMEVLFRLGNMVLTRTGMEEAKVPPKTQNHVEPATEDDQYKVDEMASNGVSDCDRYECLKRDVLTSSIFTFPIPGVSLVLPNAVKVTLQCFTFRYRTDGSAMSLRGDDGSGILLDRYPLVQTNSGGEDECCFSKSHWLLDFAARRFSIEETTKGGNPADHHALFRLRPDVLQQVLDGVNAMMKVGGEVIATVPPSKPYGSSSEDAPADLSAWTPSSESPSKWLIDIQKVVGVRLEGIPDSLECSCDGIESICASWIKLSLDSPSMVLPVSASSDFKLGGVVVGPCSQGYLNVLIPPVSRRPEGGAINVGGGISGACESFSVLCEVYEFLVRFAEGLDVPCQGSLMHEAKEGSKDSLGGVQSHLVAPEMTFVVREPSIELNMTGIIARISDIKCNELTIQNPSGALVSTSKARVSFTPNIKLTMNVVESLHLPGLISLAKPSYNAALCFRDGSLHIELNAVEGVLLDRDKQEAPQTADSEQKLNIPFAMSLDIGDIKLQQERGDATIEKHDGSRLHGLRVDLKPASEIPVLVDMDPRRQVCSYLPINVRLHDAQNALMELRQVTFSALINVEDSREVRDLRFAASAPVRICAGYSSVDWSEMFPSNRRNPVKAESYRLPYVDIAPLNFEVSYDFNIVTGKNIKLETAAFKGKSTTTSDELRIYYLTRVRAQAPDFLQNTEVLGANLIDTSLATYGTHALNATAYGGAAVGVLGVVGVDTIVGALEAGKKSRGVSSDERYKRGDFVRGIAYSAEMARKAGVTKRKAKESGSSDSSNGVEDNRDGGTFVDFVVGASSGVVEYADENKSRLGAAGAAGVGMVLGTVVAGPLGGIAGGVAAGAATGKTIKAIEKQSEKECSDDSSDRAKGLGHNTACHSSLGPQGPQGLLYKRRDIFQNQWRPRWFVLDVKNRSLSYHIPTKNAPPVVDTNFLNVLSKPASRNTEREQGQIVFEPDPKESVLLSTCNVEIDEQLTEVKQNIFAFIISPGSSQCDQEIQHRPWHLAATTEEARLMWMAMLAETSGCATDADSLLKVCGLKKE